MDKLSETRTLQDLERDDWGEPSTGETPLIQKCLALRRKPLCDFSIEDLRLGIGQKMGLKFLLPLAVQRLESDPLVSGNFYPGDLLPNVLRIPITDWLANAELRSLRLRLSPIVEQFLERTDRMDEASREFYSELIQSAKGAMESA